MSSSITGEVKKSVALSRVVISPQQRRASSAGDAIEEYATGAASTWGGSDPVPAESFKTQSQTPQPLLPPELHGSEESAEAAKQGIVVGGSEVTVERSSDHNVSSSWTPWSHSEQALPPDNCSQNETSGSCGMLTREAIRQGRGSLKPTPADDTAARHLSEAGENHEPAETPLFGLSFKEDASSAAQGSPASPEEPASLREGVSSHAYFRNQPLSTASASEQRGSDHEQLIGEDSAHESPPCHGGDRPPVDRNQTSDELGVLSSKREVPNADSIDAYEGGNEPAGGSSWRLSLSTSSDTRSDTHHVLHCLDAHPQGSPQLQRQNLTSLRQARRQETAHFPTYARANADAAQSLATTEGSHSLADGRQVAGIGLESEEKDLTGEAHQGSPTYGMAKVATDVLAGLVGMQPVAIICCFVSESPLSGLLSMFCLFCSAFAHYDKRPASYFLCSLFTLSLATTLIIALCSKLAGFENFHSMQILRRMTIAHTTVLLLTSVIAGGLGSRAVLAIRAHGDPGSREKCLKPLKRHSQRL